MRVLAMQLTANSKPLLNNTFINVEQASHSDFEMTKVDGGIEVVHKSKGCFIIPISSISWYRPDPSVVVPVAPPKRGRGRPRKASTAAA
jgi:hypothetical protein